MPRALAIACALLLGAIGGLIWWVQRDAPLPAALAPAPPEPSPSATASASPPRGTSGRFTSDERNSRRADILPDGKITVADIAATARTLHTADTTPQQDLETLQTLLDFYRRANGGANPSGSENEEIVEQLRGKNAHRLALLPPDLTALDARGRLLDRWSTPYHFHPISRTVLEIRSAGPDRKLWTKDDVALPVAEPEK